MSKEFIKGNEAMAEAAVRGGCRFFAGYPITPQNDIPEYLSKRLFEVGGTFIQGESEIASINMVYGVAATGVRSMTSSSSPGLALKSEGISFIAGSRIPAVIINVARGGPALGTIQGAQQDYFASAKAIAPGGFRCFVVSPSTVQEAADLVYEAFEIADKYRTPVYVLTDGVIGNMMEIVELPPMRDPEEMLSSDAWRITKYNDDSSARQFSTYRPTGEMLTVDNIAMAELYEEWQEKEQRWEAFMMEDAEVVLTAYGSAGRIAKSAVKELRAQGIKAGLIRPITLFPFPNKAYENINYDKIDKIFVVEMSIPPQFVYDVELATKSQLDYININTSGGVIVETESIVDKVKESM